MHILTDFIFSLQGVVFILMSGLFIYAIKSVYNGFRGAEDSQRAKALMLKIETELWLKKSTEEMLEKVHSSLEPYVKSDPKGKFVYIIQDKDVTGYFKIGRSRQLKKRLTRFDVKLPMSIRFVAIFPTDDEIRLEAAIHRFFVHKRVRGEWFNLDGFNDLRDLVSAMGLLKKAED